MSAFRNPRYFAVLLAAALLMAFGACNKNGKQEQSAGDEGAAKPSEPAAKGQFAFLPPESNFVAVIQPQKITSSTLFKDLVEPALEQQASEIEEFKAKCGFDPLDTVQSVVIGGQLEKEDTMVIAIKGITKEQLTKCAPAMAEAEGEEVEVTEQDGLTKIAANGQTTWIGWLDSNTMVMSPQGEDPAAIKAIAERTQGLGTNEEMTALIGKVDTDASIWMAMHNPDSGEQVSGVPVQAKTMYGSLDLAQGLDVDFVMQQASPEEAQNTVAMVTQQLSAFKDATPFGKYLSKLELKAEGSEVRVKLVLSDAEVKEMVPLLEQQLLPMMMMMGGGGMGGDMGGGMGEQAPAGGEPSQ